MRPRFARAFLRLQQLLLVAGVLLLAAALIACGDGSGNSSPTPTETVTTPASPSTPPSPAPTGTTAETTRLFVYFLRGEKLGVAERLVPRTTGVAVAALRELCDGPTREEREAGLGTTIPEGTELLGVTIRDGIAYVDLSSEYAGGGGSLSMTARIAQVVYTVTQFQTVQGVSFLLDGRAITELGGEGIVVSSPQTRDDWVDFEPAIFVEHPAVGSVLQSPFVLRGTASVFEGSFLAELRDASGRRIVRAVMQASEGGPGRGTFRKVIAFTTSAEKGELIVYDVSMEDGSRRNQVRIPVSFSR